MKEKTLQLLNEARKYAGLEPIIEAMDDDDDEDRDAKIASQDKKQQEFENKNKKTLDAAEKAAKAKAAKEKAAKSDGDDDASEDKKEEVSKKKDDKEGDSKKDSETPTEEKAAKAKKAAAARAWIAENPSATGGQFKAIALDKFGMGKHYANTFFYAHKNKSKGKTEVAECFVLQHPTISGYYLAENREINQFQWVDENSDLEAMLFENVDQATAFANKVADWRGTQSKISHVIFDGE